MSSIETFKIMKIPSPKSNELKFEEISNQFLIKKEISNLELVLFGIQLNATANFIQNLADNFFKHHNNLTLAGFNILVMLSSSNNKNLTQAEIARKWHVSKSAISGCIKTLKKNNLINTHQSSEDRRENIINISAKGKKVLDVTLKKYQKWVEAIFEGVEQEEINSFSSVISQIKELHLASMTRKPKI